ncbi:unnamed protein product [Effrenium voratum]|nr:unnamed protein product [Effrenium voratum]
MDSETEGSSEAGGSEGSSSPPAAPVSAVPAAAAGAAVLVVLASLLTSAWLPVQGTRILVPVLLCSMNLCFAVAFVSFWSQAHGLVGPDGILPIGSKGLPLLQTLRKAAATEGLHRRVALDLLTAVLRFGQPRPGLRLCGLGLLLAVLAAAMVSFETTRSVGALLLLLQCLIYRALFYAGSDFMALQWDTLLHEAGLWSALLALQPELPLAALRLLAAKLFLQAAACKLIAEEPTWRQLRALDYHFQSQPLPTLLGLVVHRLCCPCISKLGCGFVLAAELCAPLLSFGVHRYCRLAAFSLCAVLMLAIGLTGNYGFFNLLSTVVALSFLGDDVFAWTSRTVRELVEGQDDLVNITNVSFGPFGGDEALSDPGGVNETLKDLAGELLSELEGVPFNEEPLILQICETAFMTLLALLVGCYALENVVVLMDGFSRPSADAPEAPGWQRWLRGMRLLRQVGACGSYGLFGHVEKKRLELVISQQKQGQWQELRHR